MLPSPWTMDSTWIVEETKRASVSCRACKDTISVGSIRLGVVYQHTNGFVCINWYHIDCCSLREVQLNYLEGFQELNPTSQQEVLHKCKREEKFEAVSQLSTLCSV